MDEQSAMLKNDDSKIGISECAQLLGVSEKTVRRRISAGEIKADMIPTVHGKKYIIDRTQINTACQIIESVKIKKEYELKELALLITQEIQNREKNYEKRIKKVEELLHREREEKIAMTKQLDEIMSKIECIQTEQQRKKSFWMFWK